MPTGKATARFLQLDLFQGSSPIKILQEYWFDRIFFLGNWVNYANKCLTNHRTQLDLGIQKDADMELNLITWFKGKAWPKCKAPRYKKGASSWSDFHMEFCLIWADRNLGSKNDISA